MYNMNRDVNRIDVKKKPAVHTCFRCNGDLHEKLKDLAQQENRNLSNVIETLLLKGVESDILNK